MVLRTFELFSGVLRNVKDFNGFHLKHVQRWKRELFG